jgi:sulfite reductase beta subunit-like hemoprotein
VLADIYRYAELGFGAIEPDDLALFRWYGVYATCRGIGRQRRPAPNRPAACAHQVPQRHCRSEQLRIGSLAERYGRSMSDITTRQNIQLHNLTIEDMPLVLDELSSVGLSRSQACGDVWRNIVGTLGGVDGMS